MLAFVKKFVYIQPNDVCISSKGRNRTSTRVGEISEYTGLAFYQLVGDTSTQKTISAQP